MKQKLSVNKNRELPAYYLFFIGCVIGIVLPNLIYKMQWKQNTVSALYLMGIYAEKGSREYFWKVLRMRGGLFLLIAGSGLTIFGVLVAVGGMILLGIGMGILMTMSILQFGFHGGLIGIGLMFPQFIIYVPCFLAVSKNVYEYSMRIWKNHSSFSGQVSTYIVKMLICAVVLCAGILSEVYCNPVIMKILIQNLKIF